MAKSYSLNPEPVRWAIAAPIVAVALYLIPIPEWAIDEFYSRDMYPWLQNIFTAGSNALPFALLDVILVLAIVLVLHRARRLYFVARQRGIMDALWELARRIVRAAGILVILFYWAWGFNYRRLPLDTALPGAPVAQPTIQVLQTAFSDANALASRLRPLAGVSSGNLDDIAFRLRDPMSAALTKLQRVPLARPARPKYSLIATPFFRWAGVTGMINPYGLEAIVHVELLPYERPFVVAHEWAHLSGHADEAEASAVGWLACMSGGPDLAYSASLYLIMESAGALPGPARDAVLKRLEPGVREDLDAIAQRMRRENPTVQRAASEVYDEYLKANRVEDGTASYDRALSLILSPPFRDALSGYTISR